MTCSNLPSQLSTFIGREREIATANRLLHQTRLLTLTGPGGCGKTRLALAVAGGLVRRYPDGVWLVELAPISDPDLAPQAIAAALELREAPGRPLLDTLKTYLRPKRLLLVLDNCEHLVAACAELAHGLLTTCPSLRILVTSREPLHITGETTWTVPPLGVPDAQALPGFADLNRIEAVRLFVERAGHLAPGFALTRDNAAAIGRICSLLAGSPLAIELAAARTRVLSPDQIAARLGDALNFLATADRTVPPRHRTLQATLDWSYNLLSAGEQALFRRLAVFAAGFSLEAAEAVCPADECAAASRDRSTPVLDLLGGLIDKSLLEIETNSEPPRRFRYLEPVRQFAAAKLEQSGEAPAAGRRLVEWAVVVVERLGPGTYTRSARDSVEQLEIEHANLRAALATAAAGPDFATSRRRLAVALGQFWQNRGYICEGLAWFEPLVNSVPDVPAPLQINTLHKAAFLAIHAREFGRARRYLEQGLRLSEALDNHYGLADLYHQLCFLTFHSGDLDEAERLCALTLPMYEQAGDRWGIAIVYFYQANIDYLQGEFQSAREAVEKSVAICEEIGFIPALARRQVRLGQICRIDGDIQRARTCVIDGLRNARETGDYWCIAMAMAALAGLARHEGRHEHAAWLFGVAQYLRDRFGTQLWAVDELEYNRNWSDLRSAMGERAFSEASGRGAREAGRDLEALLRQVLDERAPQAHGQEATGPASTIAAPATPGPAALSSRERQVAALIAQGKSNAEIAAALFVGLRTVEAHVTHILNKLGFNSRAQVAAWMAGHATPPSPALASDRNKTN